MWVKLTPIELAEVKRRRKRKRIIESISITIISFFIMIFLNGQLNSMQTGYFFTPPDEIYQRIQPDFILSIIFGLLFFFYKRKSSFVCIKCGKSNVSDTPSKCQCGGSFENTEEMKWQEQKK